MRKLQTGLATAALAAAFVAPGTFQLGQANAAPIFIPQTATAQSDVIQVRDRRWRRGWYPAGAFVAGALIGGAIANSNRYYGGYYGPSYYYGPRYYGGPRYVDGYVDGYYPRYYNAPRAYYPPRTSYRAGYRDGYRDGYYARGYGNDITCTPRLADSGQC